MEGISQGNEPFNPTLCCKSNPTCQLGSPKCIFSPWSSEAERPCPAPRCMKQRSTCCGWTIAFSGILVTQRLSHLAFHMCRHRAATHRKVFNAIVSSKHRPECIEQCLQ